MSKVFHSLPQVQNHLSFLRGDQPHSGQRIRGGSDDPVFFSSSSSWSGTINGLSETGLMPSYYDLIRPLWSQEGESTDGHAEI